MRHAPPGRPPTLRSWGHKGVGPAARGPGALGTTMVASAGWCSPTPSVLKSPACSSVYLVSFSRSPKPGIVTGLLYGRTGSHPPRSTQSRKCGGRGAARRESRVGSAPGSGLACRRRWVLGCDRARLRSAPVYGILAVRLSGRVGSEPVWGGWHALGAPASPPLCPPSQLPSMLSHRAAPQNKHPISANILF